MRGLRRELNLLEDSDFGIVNKKEINDMADFVKNNNGKRNNNNRRPNNNRQNNQPVNANREPGIKAPDVCAGTIEYKMGKVMADEILKDAKGKNGKLPKPAQEILCDYVNRECGLKGYCVRVLVDVH